MGASHSILKEQRFSQTKPNQGPLGGDDDARRRLIQDPSFRLIKVVHNKNQIDPWRHEIASVTLMTPALDPEVAEDVMIKGWLCISHLWGDPSTWVTWNDAEVVDAISGESLKAKMQPDKCQEVTGLLQSWDSYWWIDVFCARSDTPLVIMGDIYRHCELCYALVDGSCEGFYSEIYRAFHFAVDVAESHLDTTARRYMEMIIDREQQGLPAKIEPGWDEILSDLMQWAFEHYQDGAYQQLNDLQERLTHPELKRFIDNLMVLPVGARESAARAYFERRIDDTGIFAEINPSSFLQQLSVWDIGNLRKSQTAIIKFLDCQWMNRVWTLQELALPEHSRVTPPWVKSGSTARQSFAGFGGLQRILGKLLKIVANAYRLRITQVSGPFCFSVEGHGVFQTPTQVFNEHKSKDPMLARIYSDYRKLLEVVIVIGPRPSLISNGRDMSRDKMQKLILNAFATSQRKALYPVDYVYGVLGILDIDIIRLEDPQEVWRLFSDKLQERFPGIRVPRGVDLSNATKMQDVYEGFEFKKENYIFSDVIDYFC